MLYIHVTYTVYSIYDWNTLKYLVFEKDGNNGFPRRGGLFDKSLLGWWTSVVLVISQVRRWDLAPLLRRLCVWRWTMTWMRRLRRLPLVRDGKRVGSGMEAAWMTLPSIRTHSQSLEWSQMSQHIFGLFEHVWGFLFNRIFHMMFSNKFAGTVDGIHPSSTLGNLQTSGVHSLDCWWYLVGLAWQGGVLHPNVDHLSGTEGAHLGARGGLAARAPKDGRLLCEDWADGGTTTRHRGGWGWGNWGWFFEVLEGFGILGICWNHCFGVKFFKFGGVWRAQGSPRTKHSLQRWCGAPDSGRRPWPFWAFGSWGGPSQLPCRWAQLVEGVEPQVRGFSLPGPGVPRSDARRPGGGLEDPTARGAGCAGPGLGGGHNGVQSLSSHHWIPQWLWSSGGYSG